MTYDLIIVAKTSPDLIQMTQNCINSALLECSDINVILVESGLPYRYENVNKHIQYNGVFNYNRALNLGLKYVKGDIYILANNDLVFKEGWSKIGELMQLNDYHSASAISGPEQGDILYEGYEIGRFLNGWCIFIDRFCLDKIGQLDETCVFWYSDNLYACQIQAAGIKHVLFCNCRVDHITSQTLVKQSPRIQRLYQTGELTKFKIRQRYYAERI
jgi:hypothetical protein